MLTCWCHCSVQWPVASVANSAVGIPIRVLLLLMRSYGSREAELADCIARDYLPWNRCVMVLSAALGYVRVATSQSGRILRLLLTIDELTRASNKISSTFTPRLESQNPQLFDSSAWTDDPSLRTRPDFGEAEPESSCGPNSSPFSLCQDCNDPT